MLALTLIIYAIVAFAYEQAAQGEASVWRYVPALVLLAWYLWRLFLRHRGALLTSFYQVFYWGGVLASAVVISTGETMVEIAQDGTANGVFWFSLLFFVIGMTATIFGYNRAALPLPELSLVRIPSNLQKLAIFSATGITLGMSSYIFLRYSGPVLLGANRVEFWSNFSRPLSLLPTLVVQTFFFSAYYFLWRSKHRQRKILAGAIVAGYALTGYFVLGQKFSLYIIFINAWLFVLAGLRPKFRLRFSTILLVSALGATLFAFLAIAYINEGREVSFIFTRIALQSQLIWSTINDGSALSLTPQNLTCFIRCEDFASGQDYISYRYLPSGLYSHYQNTNTVLSGFMPAVPLVTIGFLATSFLYIVFSFVLGWMQRKSVNAISHGELIYGFLIYKAQLGLSIFIASNMVTALPGIAITLLLIAFYHVIFSRFLWTSKQRSGSQI